MEETELDEKSRDKALETMRDALEKAGISAKLLIEKLKEELDAKQSKSFLSKDKIIESAEKIAWDIRQRARQDAHKLRGDYPAEKHEHTGDIVVHTGIIRPGDEEKGE